MENTKYHTREHAVEELNRFFDAINVKKENRVNPSVDAEFQKVLSLAKDAKAPSGDIDEIVEKSDVRRETIITLIREKRITINKDCEIEYTLIDPIRSDDGSVNIEKLTFKNRLKAKDRASKFKGADYENNTELIVRNTAARTGQMISHIEEWYDDDCDYCMIINELFQLAKRPIR